MHPNDYLAELKTLGKEPVLTPGSSEEAAAIERFKDYFSNVTEDSIRTKTGQVYSADAFFNDTLKTLRGADKIEHYLLETSKNVSEFRVEMMPPARSGPDYYFRWIMTVGMKRFGNKSVTTIGMTHVRFDPEGKVRLHQDYWDSAAGLWDHVPVIGSGIRWIKSRL
ncbi:MAG: hypothetical protein SNJ52_05150 [Verrucomicrobiia bacterium]